VEISWANERIEPRSRPEASPASGLSGFVNGTLTIGYNHEVLGDLVHLIGMDLDHCHAFAFGIIGVDVYGLAPAVICGDSEIARPHLAQLSHDTACH
jgi:hypothetical protein